MDVIKVINGIISFTVELVMLALLAIGGYNILTTAQIGRWVVAILLPGMAIGVWAYFIAPNNAHRLSQPWLCVAQLVLFTIAAAVAYKFTNHTLIVIFIACAYASSILAVFTKQ